MKKLQPSFPPVQYPADASRAVGRVVVGRFLVVVQYHVDVRGVCAVQKHDVPPPFAEERADFVVLVHLFGVDVAVGVDDGVLV